MTRRWATIVTSFAFTLALGYAAPARAALNNTYAVVRDGATGQFYRVYSAVTTTGGTLSRLYLEIQDATHATVATIDLGQHYFPNATNPNINPGSVAALTQDPATRALYVVYTPAPDGTTTFTTPRVVRIDPDSRTVTQSVDLIGFPFNRGFFYSAALDPARGALYFTQALSASGSAAVYGVSLAAGSAGSILPRPSSLSVNTQNPKLVADATSGRVFGIQAGSNMPNVFSFDPATAAVSTLPIANPAVSDFMLDAATRTLYAATSVPGTLLAADADAMSISWSLPLAANGTGRLAFDAAAQTIYAGVTGGSSYTVDGNTFSESYTGVAVVDLALRQKVHGYAANLAINAASGPSVGTRVVAWVDASHVLHEDNLQASGMVRATVNTLMPPGVPWNAAAVNGLRAVHLTWEPPLFDGGAPITAYKVFLDGAEVATLPADARDYVFAGLASGSYRPGVAAVNAGGVGGINSYLANTASGYPSLDVGGPVRVPIGASPSGVGVDPVLQRTYVVYADGETMDVFETSMLQRIATVPVPAGPGRLIVDETRHRVYVAAGGNMDVIDGLTLQTIARIPLPDFGWSYDAILSPKMAIDADRHKVYVAWGSLYVVDAEAAALETVLNPGLVYGVAVNPTTHEIYLSTQDGITVLDAAYTVIKQLRVDDPNLGSVLPTALLADPRSRQLVVLTIASRASDGVQFDYVASASLDSDEFGTPFTSPVYAGGFLDGSINTVNGYAYVRFDEHMAPSSDWTKAIDAWTRDMLFQASSEELFGVPHATFGDDSTFTSAVDSVTNTVYVVARSGFLYVYHGQVRQQPIALSSESAARVGTTAQVQVSVGLSGTPITFEVDGASTLGACTVNANGLVSFASEGLCRINARQAGDDNFAAGAASIDINVAEKLRQQIVIADPGPAAVGESVTLSATGGGSGNPVTFAIDAGTADGVCSVMGSVLSYTGAGTCIVAANQLGGDGYFDADRVTLGIAVSKGTQTIEFAGPGDGVYLGHATLAAAGGASGNPIVFSVDASSGAGVCAVTDATVSYAKAGTCVIAANQDGSPNYEVAPTVTVSITVAKADTPLIVTGATDAVVGDTVALDAIRAGSHTAFQFGVNLQTASGTCGVAGNVVSLTIVGTCLVDISQTGDPNLVDAHVTHRIDVRAAAAAITWMVPAPIVYGTALGAAQLNATANMTGAFTYAPASGTVLNAGAAQTLTVTFTPDDARYTAVMATVIIDVLKAPQTIAVTAPGDGVYLGNATLTGGGGASGNPVTFSVDPSSGAGVCTIGGNVVSYTAAGVCVIAANQAGSANYLAAPAITVAITVSKAAQRLSLPVPADARVGDSLQLAATPGGSHSSITYEVNSQTGAGICVVSGDSVSFVGAGVCTIDARQAGDANYLDAIATSSITVHPAAQVITFAGPATGISGGSAVLAATGGASGNPVIFSVDPSSGAGVCAVSGTTVAYAAAGTCVIAANQAGNANYLAAATVTATIVVNAPPSPVQRLADAVEALVRAARLASKDAAPLLAKLQAAADSLRAGNVRAAANQADAFLNQVIALVRSRRLSATDAAALTGLAADAGR